MAVKATLKKRLEALEAAAQQRCVGALVAFWEREFTREENTRLGELYTTDPALWSDEDRALWQRAETHPDYQKLLRMYTILTNAPRWWPMR